MQGFFDSGAGVSVPTIQIGSDWFALSTTADSVGGTFTGGNDVALYAIPEPGTWAMLLGGFGMLVIGRRMLRRMS